MKEFELFADGERMKAIFQEQLPGFSQGELVITGCRVLRTRYKTYTDARRQHRSFLCAHYELEIASRDNQPMGRQQLYARAYLNGRSQLKFRQLVPSQLARPRFGEGLVHLPGLGLIVWAFPNDPQLDHLPAAVNGEQIRPYLPYSRLPAGFNQPTHIVDVGAQVIRYKPEVRCTIRYDLRGNEPDSRESLLLYGKTYRSDMGREVYRHIDRLWQQSRADPHHFRVAEPLGYDETLQMVWQEALSGVPLSALLSPATYTHFLPAAARGLAHLHASPPDGALLITSGDLFAEIAESTAELMEALPEFKARLRGLLARLARHAPLPTTLPGTLIHRDFHVKQLLVLQDGSLALFDFDDLAAGDPLQDIAFFVVDLHCRSIDPPLVAAMTHTFWQAYWSYSGGQLPESRLQWHIRLQSLAKAHWYYKKKQRSPRLKAHIGRLLALAEEGMLTKELLL